MDKYSQEDIDKMLEEAEKKTKYFWKYGEDDIRPIDGKQFYKYQFEDVLAFGEVIHYESKDGLVIIGNCSSIDKDKLEELCN